MDNLTPQELDELQRLSYPGSLRQHLLALRSARETVACGEIALESRISYGVAKGARLTTRLEVGPAMASTRKSA